MNHEEISRTVLNYLIAVILIATILAAALIPEWIGFTAGKIVHSFTQTIKP